MSMGQPRAARGIGTYMRTIAMLLKKDEPSTARHMFEMVHTPDEGYAAATLIRLRQRGIATEVDGSGYIRGPEWAACAAYYGWPHQDIPRATQE
jgi:hypothetical protein